jgi:cell division protein FtsB
MGKRTYRCISLVLLVLILFGAKAYEWGRLSFQQRKLDRQLTELSSEHQRLLEEQERLQSDPVYVEGLIRTTFKWAKPDERVIRTSAKHGNW